MSILQFIVDMRWAFFALLGLLVVIVWSRRLSKDTRDALRAAVLARSFKASVGSLSLEMGAPASSDTVAVAAAPDEELAKNLEPSETESTAEQVQQIRRDAVEKVMREAAEWGWTMAQVGFKNPPVPQITWNGDRPEIDYGFSPLERDLFRMSANRGGYPGI